MCDASRISQGLMASLWPVKRRFYWPDSVVQQSPSFERLHLILGDGDRFVFQLGGHPPLPSHFPARTVWRSQIWCLHSLSWWSKGTSSSISRTCKARQLMILWPPWPLSIYFRPHIRLDTLDVVFCSRKRDGYFKVELYKLCTIMGRSLSDKVLACGSSNFQFADI